MRISKTFKLALAVVALSTVTACAARGDAPAQAADATSVLYQRNCAVCHGKNGEGQQVGTLTVPTLREGRAATDTDERLLAQISNGGNGMPPFKFSLSDEEIRDLLRFVREDVQGRARKP